MMYIFLVIWLLVPLASSALGLLLMGHKRASRYIGKLRHAKQSKKSKKEHLRSIGGKSDLAAGVLDLVDRDGAGDWPPRANYDSWPEPLQPYRSILQQLLPKLATSPPSKDDAINAELISNLRTDMRAQLGAQVQLDSVLNILSEVEANDWTSISRDQLNAFYCCMALSRHAYRWATSPVVKVAQLEKELGELNLPPELDLPWPYLQRYYGVVADCGNHTSNVLLNFDPEGKRMFKLNSKLSPLVQSTEEGFFRLLYDVEAEGLEIYCDIVDATLAFQNGRSTRCLHHLKSINESLNQVLKIFARGMSETHISRSVWLSYVQGLHGWGLGRWIDNEFVKFNGVSGSHVLVFHALDAFLGMENYLGVEDGRRYIPESQRTMCRIIKEHSFHSSPKVTGNQAMRAEFEKMVEQIRKFRTAHRARVMPYLKQPAPERFHMTAGKSVLTTKASMAMDEVIAPLDKQLVDRLQQTKDAGATFSLMK